MKIGLKKSDISIRTSYNKISSFINLSFFLIAILILSAGIVYLSNNGFNDIGNIVDAKLNELYINFKKDSEGILKKLGEEQIYLQATKAAEEINSYIMMHPELTIADLQKDENFRTIAIQPVGKTGYTAVHNASTLINYFHTNPKIINTDLNSLRDRLPDFLNILQSAMDGKSSEGYYDWLEKDGSVRNKYMWVSAVKGQTADNVRLAVAATTYIDEFFEPSINLNNKMAKTKNNIFLDIKHSSKKTINRVLFVILGLILIFTSLIYIMMLGIIRSRNNAFKEIAERIKIENELKISENNLRLMLENVVGAIFIADIQTGLLLDCNKQAESLIGRNRNEIIGMKQIKLHPEGEAEKYKKQFALHVEKGRNFNYEGEVQHKDGRRIPVWITAQGMEMNKKKVLVGLFIDITERRKIEKENIEYIMELEASHYQLKETQNQLIQSEKLGAVGRLASGVAHEVKNPLAIIMQSAEYLTNKIPPEHKEIIQMITTNIKRADTIIRTLVDFSRTSELKLIPEDINSILESSLVLVQHRIRQESIKIIKEFKEGLPKVLIDKNNIEQVFVNILINAIQAMPKGGNIFVRTYVSEFEEPKRGVGRRIEDFFKLKEKVVTIEVEDTGEGIKKENLDKIFEPFFTTKEPGAGTGLGLAVTNNIIAMHKGLIEIKSKVGEGTKVIVILKTERKSHEQEKGIDS